MAFHFKGVEEISAMGAIAFAMGDPVWPDLESKVIGFKRILLGAMSVLEMEKIIARKKPEHRGRLDFEQHDGVVFVHAPGAYNVARRMGNWRYSVLIVSDPEYPTPEGLCHRMSLIRQLNAAFDFQGCKEAVNEENARGWKLSRKQMEDIGLDFGGNSAMFSSPMGVYRDPKISKENFLWIAQRHLQ